MHLYMNKEKLPMHMKLSSKRKIEDFLYFYFWCSIKPTEKMKRKNLFKAPLFIVGVNIFESVTTTVSASADMTVFPPVSLSREQVHENMIFLTVFSTFTTQKKN